MDFPGLRNAIQELVRAPSQVASKWAPLITKRLQKQYDRGVDAYGNPWIPLAQSTIDKKGHDQILVEHGDTREGTYAKPQGGAGIALHVGIHGHWHQEGKPKYRPILPDFGLPATWRADLEKVWKEIRRKRK